MSETIGLLAAAAACFLAGMHVGQWLERRRSPRQVVGSSRSAGQPVTAAAAQRATPIVEGVVNEELEWLRIEKNRIVTKLTEDFPSLGGGQRESIAEEIMAKARTTLARVR